MEGAKEFTARSLDEAIKAACDYFDLPREKLEVEIINDAKSGIFGLVGAKKAKVRAREASVDVVDANSAKGGDSKKSSQAGDERSANRRSGSSRDSNRENIRDNNREGSRDATRDATRNVSERDNSERSRRGARDGDGRDEPSGRDVRDVRDGRDGRDGRNRQNWRDRQSGRSGQEEPFAESSLTSPKDAQSSINESFTTESPTTGASAEDGAASDFSRSHKRPFKRQDGARPARRRSFDSARGESTRGDSARGERSFESARDGEGFNVSSEDRFAGRRSNYRSGERGESGERNDRGLEANEDSALNSIYETEFDDVEDFEASFGDRVTRFETLDMEVVKDAVKEALAKLTAGICPDALIDVSIEEGRVEAYIDCGETSGLLIGRDGQTLSALQYMASRIVSSQMKALVHVNLDTGDYKERQEQKLRSLAAYLADKAKNSGRTQSTRPLSSYHRRIVHMVLQGETDIETRSKGDGPVKRVYIYVKS